MNKTSKKESDIQIQISNQEDWENLMQRDGLNVVDVHQEWSGPCQAVIGLFRHLKVDLNDDLLQFATANAEKVESLDKYRGRSEPYFLIYGGSNLVAVVKGANPPELEATIKEMLKQEHDVITGEVARVIIDDKYLIAIEEEKALEAKRKSLEMEVEQETAVLIINPDINGSRISEDILTSLNDNGFEIIDEFETELSDEQVSKILLSETDDPDFASRLVLMSKGKARCLLVKHGPVGVTDAFQSVIGLKAADKLTEFTKKMFVNGEEIEEIQKPIPTIREKLGNNNPKSLVTYLTNKDMVDGLRKYMFPDYEPPNVIVYRQEEEIVKDIASPIHTENDATEKSKEQSSTMPEYEGPQRVLFLIRPSAYLHYKDQILAKLADANFTILSKREKVFSEEEAREYYVEMSLFSIFEDIIAEMISGPSLVLLCSKVDANKDMKELLGPESYAQAIQDNPQSLRGMFSSVSEVEKTNDLTWIEGTRFESDVQKQLPFFFPYECTLAVLKPESIVVEEELIALIKAAKFKIVARKQHTMSLEDIKVLYEPSINKPYFDDLVKHLTSGPTLCLILKASDGVQVWRRVMGCSNPDEATDNYPDDVDPEKMCLRAIYGRNLIQNALHGSSSIEHADKCINQIFGEDWTIKPPNGTSDTEAGGEEPTQEYDGENEHDHAQDGEIFEGQEGGLLHDGQLTPEKEASALTENKKSTSDNQLLAIEKQPSEINKKVAEDDKTVAENDKKSIESENKALASDMNVLENDKKPSDSEKQASISDAKASERDKKASDDDKKSS